MLAPLVAAIALGALGPPLADSEPAHLGIVLGNTNPEGLRALLDAQQDPSSPWYRRYLTPAEFGERFGVDAASTDAMVKRLRAQGFEVTVAPNRLFLDATGTVAGVRNLLGVQLEEVESNGRPARAYEGDLRIPAELAGHLLYISGLDTRIHLKHRISTSQGDALGADDLRLQYDLAGLIATGQAASGLTTVVLGTQEGTGNRARAPFVPPSVTAIQTYFTNISHATAPYNPIVLPNANNDFDTPGANEEYQLDVEMQSVGAANAADIDLVLPPASEVFTTGVQYIANTLSTATVVSISLGLCEYEENFYYPGEMASMQQAIQQGLAEGQAWFAASGDSGSDDCADNNSNKHDGYDGGNPTVDFPASLPEVVAMGGSQFSSAQATWFDTSNALTGVQPETTWNEGNTLGGGGGGQSRYFAKPSWQVGIGPKSTDGARDVPDLALMAAVTHPGVAVYDCGSGQGTDPGCNGATNGAGNLDVFGGTSVAAPLAAGVFALVSGQVGCKLGDIHPTLYALGQTQQGGGALVFHDINTGSNALDGLPGFGAGAGYDLATGWGSIDVDQLIANWPVCSSGTTGTTGTSTTGTSASSTTGTTGTGTVASSTTGTSATSTASSTTGTSAVSTTGTSAGSTATSTTGSFGTVATSTSGSGSTGTFATSTSSSSGSGSTGTVGTVATSTSGSGSTGTVAASSDSGSSSTGTVGATSTTGTSATSTAGSTTGTTSASATATAGSTGVAASTTGASTATASTGTAGSTTGTSATASTSAAGASGSTASGSTGAGSTTEGSTGSGSTHGASTGSSTGTHGSASTGTSGGKKSTAAGGGCSCASQGPSDLWSVTGLFALALLRWGRRHQEQ
ncbi:MAG: S8/S53 family peptidase [Deltaproteobacteria bacterium]|nr:S8/S53 family peptidase [Deltaproteobacteria bacterium]